MSSAQRGTPVSTYRAPRRTSRADAEDARPRLLCALPGRRSPLLITDPWLVGSVYWRSWWLQNYPSAEEVDWLANSAWVYITHEHPDHFHMPTIRRLGSGPQYLFPALGRAGLPRLYDCGTDIVPNRRAVTVAGDRRRGVDHVDPGVERRQPAADRYSERVDFELQ